MMDSIVVATNIAGRPEGRTLTHTEYANFIIYTFAVFHASLIFACRQYNIPFPNMTEVFIGYTSMNVFSHSLSPNNVVGHSCIQFYSEKN